MVDSYTFDGVHLKAKYIQIWKDIKNAVIIRQFRQLRIPRFNPFIVDIVSLFYASTGLTVYKIFDSPIVEVPGQKKKITVEEALQANSFASDA